MTSRTNSLFDWLTAGKEFGIVDESIDRLNPLLAEILAIDGCA